MKRIAIQGLKGSFHHEAALRYFGDTITLVECETFSQVTEQLLQSHADFGVMAIENSLAGSIIPNYLLIRHPELTICGELTLRVKMNLMVLGTHVLSDITEVRSHEMAIRQCTSFLKMNPNLKVVEAFDTAGSAADIHKNGLQGVAAIASELAAKTYGLDIIAKGIEDNQRSHTRFLILSREIKANPQADKASLYLETVHEVGALAAVLSAISSKNINLSKLQSHPVPHQKGAYGFFIDLEIASEQQLEELLHELKSLTRVLECLGTYQKGKSYE